ncbi:MAG: ABC transporter ATP-binding protein [Bryobacteraceae bacterium]|nr:ABC transporter ATP-binding protein [Bryobacteraceae bacterium]
MPPPVVVFRDVSFRYAHQDVLHSLSFELRPGEVVGLLGPNGAGKSTTIKIITGILAAHVGTVQVFGLSLPERSLDVKQSIGYVPEAALLFESLTGQEFLELCGRLHLVDEDRLQHRIAELLETFGLASDRSTRLDAYSKGMRQKILIAAALLHDPALILLDEPLTGLDVNASVLVKDLIAALAAAGKTVLYSSHVLDVVERVCDRAIIIDNGAIVADDSPSNLIAAAGAATLEGVFQKLTGAGAPAAAAARIIHALHR